MPCPAVSRVEHLYAVLRPLVRELCCFEVFRDHASCSGYYCMSEVTNQCVGQRLVACPNLASCLPSSGCAGKSEDGNIPVDASRARRSRNGGWRYDGHHVVLQRQLRYRTNTFLNKRLVDFHINKLPRSPSNHKGAPHTTTHLSFLCVPIPLQFGVGQCPPIIDSGGLFYRA